MNDDHISNVAGFIVFFVVAALFMIFCNQINALIKSRRTLKYASQIKVGGVITKKIPQPETPCVPPWANMHMENRITGEIRPVCADKTGFWYLGGEETEPQKLSLREWMIKNV